MNVYEEDQRGAVVPLASDLEEATPLVEWTLVPRGGAIQHTS